MKNKSENRFEITVKDTHTGDIRLKMNCVAICVTATNVICDGKGSDIRQICTHDTDDSLILKYTYKAAKQATKGMKKKYKLLKRLEG